MKNITINVYERDMKTVKKTLIAREYDLSFGTIRKLMGLLRLESAEDSFELVKIVHEAWDEITEVLDLIFIEATDEDWDNVKVAELLPALVAISKYSLKAALKIPTEKN